MTTMLLIRHATNDWVGERLAGWTPGVHLNETGQQQALALAGRLAHVAIDAIYSSPLERALETAAPLANRLGLTVQVEVGLGEVQYGQWTGGTLKELRETDLWRVLMLAPSLARFPEGESLGEVQHRVVGTLEQLRSRHPQETIAIVSHADVLKAVVAFYAGMHLDLFQRLVINPASVSVVQFDGIGVPRLLRFNDTGELPSFARETPPAASPAAATPNT